MGCYYVHHVIIKNNDTDSLKSLLAKEGVINECDTNRKIYNLNLKKCSELDFAKDNIKEENWQVTFHNNIMFYRSRLGSDTPVYYISKLLPDIVFEEANSFGTECDGSYELRTWKNGECIKYYNSDLKNKTLEEDEHD